MSDRQPCYLLHIKGGISVRQEPCNGLDFCIFSQIVQALFLSLLAYNNFSFTSDPTGDKVL